MDVGGAGIEPGFDAKRTSFFFGLFQAGSKLSFVDNVDGVMTKEIERINFGGLP